MLKKIGLPAIALLGLLAMAPHPAKAAVRFGVVVGAPAVTYPVYPVYPAAPVVVAPAPVIVGGGWVGRDLRWDRRHDFRFRR
jgi:Flp pilus assembly protein CpaB